jgi:hypothetical protein
MKTIALSMIFSLVVIVCEEQTLFAPHIVTFDGLRAANPNISCLVCTELCDCKPGNSLVPIAGVNRSVPLAGSGYNPGKGASRAIVHPEFSPSSSRAIVHPEFSPSGPDRKPTVDGAMPIPALMRPDRGNSLEHGPGMHDSLHDDSAFLPWHRGYFGITGSADPGGDDI